MDKPTTTLHTGHLNTALLLIMGQLGQAHKQDIYDEFERQFGYLIPPPQREKSTTGKVYWQTKLLIELVTSKWLHH